MPTTDNTSDNSILTRLRELVKETDHEFVIELVDIYLNEAPVQIQTISNALLSSDHHLLSISAHTLKGSSLNLGAKQLGKACLKLEEVGRSGEPIPQSASTKEVEKEFELVKTELLLFKQSS